MKSQHKSRKMFELPEKYSYHQLVSSYFASKFHFCFKESGIFVAPEKKSHMAFYFPISREITTLIQFLQDFLFSHLNYLEIKLYSIPLTLFSLLLNFCHFNKYHLSTNFVIISRFIYRTWVDFQELLQTKHRIAEWIGYP